MKKIIAILILVLVGTLAAQSVSAADFNISPSRGTYGVTKEFSAEISINTFGESINAAQGRLVFDPEVITIKSVSKDGSAFNFWLQEPTFDNAEGVLDFIGGTPNGVSGSKLKVVTVVFLTQNIGISDFSFINASITSSDGTGTNISGDADGATYSVSSGGGGSNPGDYSSDDGANLPPPEPEPVPEPVQITREPTKATGLPSEPDVKVPFYPDPGTWYNLVSNFTASWDLPSDIAELSTAVNTNPNYEPDGSEGLFDNKTFPALVDDGIYYLHVRFKNNIGWGPTAHYKIALDTEPPLPFDITVTTGESSDDPSPVLMFNTGDGLSGVGSYTVYINDEEPIRVNISSEGVVEQVPTLTILETGVSFLNVRDEPSTSGEIVVKVNPGDTFEYTAQDGEWYQIVLEDGGTGWVFGKYIEEIEGEVVTVATSKEYELKPHPPGVYAIRVVVSDYAGNGVEARAQVEITPIDLPVITSITERVTIGTDERLAVKGIALPDS